MLSVTPRKKMTSREKLESAVRRAASEYIYLLEAALYVGVAILLCTAAGIVIFNAAVIVWQSGVQGKLAEDGLLVLDQLLLVLMLVEILHTVRISIHSKELILLEPFLIVGLIASIRRILVITLQSALANPAVGTVEAAISFRNSMIELAILGLLILTLVVSIYLLRRALRDNMQPAK